MMRKLFVFGTLKKGFPLHGEGLSEAAFLGAYRTRERFPMLIAGPRFAPMMFNEPGVGFQVGGELYAVDDRALANLDRIESVGKPGNLRVLIEAEPVDGGPPVSAYLHEIPASRRADPLPISQRLQ
ncbi:MULTISPECIES: gamma-glutamylcyclotransferase family protein [unclassified Mesorhizobium]|uniref:gamma-glutamylcyclotransferase family protein n=1 Tax=unclassified Mesorhizobium TaxID=325217 RepID=UPI001FED2FB2|nr:MULTISPECIES: gamma-glutamylcyclotransferase family protein [unclassified Mesorhizobium]